MYTLTIYEERMGEHARVIFKKKDITLEEALKIRKEYRKHALPTSMVLFRYLTE